MRSKIVITLFVVTLVAVGMLNALFPSAASVSELENRTLAGVPEFSGDSLLSGDYFSGWDSYYSDHFYKRERFVMISQNINEYRGIKGQDHVELVMMDSQEFVQDEQEVFGLTESSTLSPIPVIAEEVVLIQEEKTRILTNADLNQRVRNLGKKDIDYFTDIEPLVFEPSDNDAILAQMTITDDEQLSGSQQNGILVINDECFEIFRYSENVLDTYAEAINAFAESLEGENKVYSLIAPAKIEFVKSEKYRDMAESQADSINYLNEQFSDRVTPVNAYTPLQEHTEEYTYFRSDHHWTQLGAYYAYTAFAKTIGDRPYELDAFEMETADNFLGSLYNKTLSRTVKENADHVDIYRPFVDSDFKITTKSGGILNWEVINENYKKASNKYMVFISGDNPLSVIDTDLDNGKKIMVFKDSYGNAFVPWLMSHYDEIHIIDPRHYDKGAVSYAQNHDIHEFLFLNYNMVIGGHTGFAKNIYKVTY